jgi:hypothetical protein
MEDLELTTKTPKGYRVEDFIRYPPHVWYQIPINHESNPDNAMMLKYSEIAALELIDYYLSYLRWNSPVLGGGDDLPLSSIITYTAQAAFIAAYVKNKGIVDLEALWQEILPRLIKLGYQQGSDDKEYKYWAIAYLLKKRIYIRSEYIDPIYQAMLNVMINKSPTIEKLQKSKERLFTVPRTDISYPAAKYYLEAIDEKLNQMGDQ